MHPQMKNLQRLTASEKLQIVEELWDDLTNSPEPIPFPQWHRDEASRRAAELDADPSMAIDRDTLWRRVGGQDG